MLALIKIQISTSIPVHIQNYLNPAFEYRYQNKPLASKYILSSSQAGIQQQQMLTWGSMLYVLVGPVFNRELFVGGAVCFVRVAVPLEKKPLRRISTKGASGSSILMNSNGCRCHTEKGS